MEELSKKILIFVFLFPFFSLVSVNPPSEEAFEKEESIPIISQKQKQDHVRFDFYDPVDKVQREKMNLYLTEVENEKTYRNVQWLRLLRYKENLFGGFHSEVVSDSFFLSEKGSTDPRKELLATIRGLFFFSDDTSDISPECRFPERYRWLRNTLKFERIEFRTKCSRFENWKQGVNVSSAKIVFASYYLQSPASMFGHTFLKLNQRKNESSELLDYAVGYAAEPGEIDPIRYVIGGISGGYTGKFSIFPYYIKVNEYNDMENRDLWEYELQLTEMEKEILLGHLWEMGNAEFDYFFHKENCAYQLLRLMEVVKHTDLGIGNKFTISPTDLLKILKDNHIFVTDAVLYRASLYQKISDQLERLDEKDRKNYWERLLEINKNEKVQLDKISNETIVPILLDTFKYRSPNQLITSESYVALLQMQSKIHSNGETLKQTNLNSPPDSAHGGRNLNFGYGNSTLGNFSEIEARLAYHDILNVSTGLPSASEIQFLNVKLRNYENRKLEVTNLSLVKLSSLASYNQLSKKHSYYIDLGSQTISLHSAEQRKAVGNMDLLYGYSFTREFSNGFNWGVFSLLGGVKTHSNREFNYGLRYGPQVMINYLYEWKNWKLQWLYSYSYLSMSSNDNFFNHSVRLRYALGTNHEIRIEYSSYPFYSESLISYHYLF